ncbi:MAG: DNA methyltransferase [bacterium]|nr:DNA methyltransferase [bacterium]
MDEPRDKERAPRNRTITLSDEERARYTAGLCRLSDRVDVAKLCNTTINQDLYLILDYLPHRFVDLLFIDPPYNLTKDFGAASFKEMTSEEYAAWFSAWFARLLPVLKPSASVYICGDWRSSGVIQSVVEKHLVIQNRITWEREKGRGAKRNWKNCSEDIWFCTVSKDFCFNADAVKLKRRVIAPYKDENGKPKDWDQTESGDFRLTCPSNMWTDLSVPFWSMPENTDHPTQKPEKLLAKVILASSQQGDLVFDPFLGSGTTSVVAKKLGRLYCGIEIDTEYCCLTEKRLAMAALENTIQGYSDGVFWERNTLAYQNGNTRNGTSATNQLSLCLREGRTTYAK